ncbi:inositol hexakisphosphate kinase 3-like isoform X1 [Dendronephthya gigantea]|uniref:inositol hexakisphosphate kinase 3-like isoform X1 n=1 Tax=Dendronephthya gigantea TaxID=151771 RepID=UPI001069EEB9|nr:inositol hexakisphosphate kinase 3-like isoform X1 [Dendronephthya gigantea]
MGDTKNQVSLRPFAHQVGGHSNFQQFDNHTVCKPLFSKELKFYQEIPSALKPFIPQFKGVVTAEIKEDYEGEPSLIIHPNGPVHFVSDDISKDLSGSDDDIQNPCDVDEEKDRPHLRGPTSSCHSQRQFLILENVISRYHSPSILDLKMGTQIHSDSKTSEEEMKRRRSKWEKTTARTLGVRLGGMKVYHVDCGKCFYMNNNDGRKLSEHGFEKALRMFFDNGETFRCALISCFIQKLKNVLDVMEKDLCSYRFYNSSLLLVYEGEVAGYSKRNESDCFTNTSNHHSTHDTSLEQCTCECTSEQLDIRMIDFQHVSRDDSHADKSCCVTCPDKGYIFGLKSLIRILRKIQNDHHRGRKESLTDGSGKDAS